MNASTGNRTLLSTDHLIDDGTGTNPCVQLYDGRDLNMNGATISCTNNTDCSTAVRAYSAGSILEGGTIEGPFGWGARNIEEVRNLRIDGPTLAIDGNSLTKRVHGNVITDANIGVILGTDAGATSYVRDNFMDEGRTIDHGGGAISESAGIVACSTSGSGPKVESNFVRSYDFGISCEDCTANGALRILENVLANIGQGEIELFCDNPTLTSNICDDLSDCPLPSPPFLLP